MLDWRPSCVLDWSYLYLNWVNVFLDWRLSCVWIGATGYP